MKKNIVSLFIMSILASTVIASQAPMEASASGITPLVFGSASSTFPNLNDFVSSGYFSQAESNYKYATPPALQTWQGTQALSLMPAGHTIKHTSLFLKNKVDISRSEHKGISTFMEFSLHKGEHQWAGDGFSFVLARDDFRTKSRNGYATGGIDNSLAIRFSTWRPNPINSTGLQVSVSKNGLIDDASLVGTFQNVDLALGTISPGIGAYGLLRIYKIWIDLDGETGNLEIRVRFDNSYVRPELPTVTYSNISMADLTDQFYAGITVSGGGLSLGLFLNHMYAANQYLPNGIDMTNTSQYVVDRTAPTTPSLEPLRTETGYKLNPSSTDDLGGNVGYEYKLDENPYAPATLDTEIPFGTRQVLVRAFDSISNASTVTTIDFIKATYYDPFGDPLPDQWYPTTHPLALEEPTRVGYTFDGWYSESTLETQVTELSTTGDSNLYPKWIANPYRITFNSNGGSEIDDITQGFETLVLEPTAPTKTGHTFLGWFSDEALTLPYAFDTMPMQDFQLFAKWSLNSYTLSYETFGGVDIPSVEVPYRTPLVDIPTPVKDHAFFEGWYLDAELTEPLGEYSMPAEGVTLYASWIDATPVENLIALVEGWPTPLDLSYAQSLLDAKALLESLTIAQDAYVPDDIREAIEQAEIRIHNLTVVDNLESQFEAIDAPVSLDDEEYIQSLREQYNQLNADQKALFDEDLLNLLLEAESRLIDLNAVEEVTALFQFDYPITLDDETDVESIREAYEGLTESQKALFDEELLDELEEAERIIANLKAAKNVIDLIESLNVDDLDDEEKVAAARAAYQNLTDAQKALIDDEILDLLEGHEAEVVRLIEENRRVRTNTSILIFHLTGGFIMGLFFVLKMKKVGSKA